MQLFTKLGIFGDLSKSAEEIEAEKLVTNLEGAAENFARMFDLEAELAFLNSANVKVQQLRFHQVG